MHAGRNVHHRAFLQGRSHGNRRPHGRARHVPEEVLRFGEFPRLGSKGPARWRDHRCRWQESAADRSHRQGRSVLQAWPRGLPDYRVPCEPARGRHPEADGEVLMGNRASIGPHSHGGHPMSLIVESLAQLAPAFGGQLLLPDDVQYDQARRVHNGLVDKRPALIARCAGVADIVDAVKLAKTLNLDVAVRGGGHNVAGRATIDDGLMIDLSLLKGIQVDVRARTVRAQGGVLWKELNRETQLHGLATTGGVVSTTGFAGLTRGGGLGWLMPKYGLALDNLRSVELVMADGTVRRASREESPDLFWAVRGGGGNFGIAASLEYDLHPVGPIITGGLVAHPLQKAGDGLAFFPDTCTSAPDDMMLTAGLLSAPDGSGAKLVGIIAAHCGPLEEGEAAVKPLKA